MELSTYATKSVSIISKNITVDEKLAIKNLKANQNIIIQSADERGEIVIMNRNQ